MVTDAQEHALDWWWRSHPSIPGIAGARHPKPTSSACFAAGARSCTALANNLDLGGSSTKGLVTQGPSPRRTGSAATRKGIAPTLDPWTGFGNWQPDFCAATDFDPSL